MKMMRLSFLKNLQLYSHMLCSGFHSMPLKLMGVKGTELRMPALSPTMTQGTIVKWLKKEGDAVSPGDALCEIQTDKAVMTYDIEEEGILAKILMPDDSKDVQIGTLLALMVEEGADWKSVDVPSGTSMAPSVQSSEKPTLPSATPSSQTKKTTIGPAAKTLLEAYNLETSRVTPSGPHGILLKGDILKFIDANKLKPAPPKPVSPPVVTPSSQVQKPSTKTTSISAPGDDEIFSDISNSNMRQTIARRLTESKTTIPHAYSTVECHVDAVVNLRKKLKADGITVSINDFIIKAVAVALQRVPEVNAQLVGDAVRILDNIDISIAVATESGLITPIIKDAVGLGVAEISKRMKELSEKARSGKLQPHEFMGGSFTISNLGMFGITEFTAIINPPQSAILAVGASRLVLDSDGKPRTKMCATMSYDGRVFDDEVAARFLGEFSNTIENPSLLLAALGPRMQQFATAAQ